MDTNQQIHEPRLCTLQIPGPLHEDLKKIKSERKASLQSTILRILKEHVEDRNEER